MILSSSLSVPGAEVEIYVFNNLNVESIERSLRELSEKNRFRADSDGSRVDSPVVMSRMEAVSLLQCVK